MKLYNGLRVTVKIKKWFRKVNEVGIVVANVLTPIIIKDHETGRLYSVGDIDSAVTIIDELTNLESTAKRHPSINTALSQVQMHHSLKKVGNKYATLIQQLSKKQRCISH